MLDAACAGMIPDGPNGADPFFPEKNDTKIANDAIMVCFGCSVRKECKDYKKRTDSNHGIWAGEFSKRKKKEDEPDGET